MYQYCGQASMSYKLDSNLYFIKIPSHGTPITSNYYPHIHKMVITVPADGRAPSGARLSADTVMAMKSHMFIWNFFGYTLFWIIFIDQTISFKITDKIYTILRHFKC